MKLSSANRRPISRAKAKNAALLNQLATPGLGSLFCKRWIAGTGQLLAFLAGFVLFIAWFFQQMSFSYQLAFNDFPPQPPGLKLFVWGSALCVVAWLWSAFTSLSLLRAASNSGLRSLENMATPPPLKLDDAKIFLNLASVPDWKNDGGKISRTFQFKDFPEAVKFVNAVAQIAEEEWHHPDIDVRWNKVTLALTTHDSGGLTEKDFALAKKFNKVSIN